jgi:hypothetical protein
LRDFYFFYFFIFLKVRVETRNTAEAVVEKQIKEFFFFIPVSAQVKKSLYGLLYGHKVEKTKTTLWSQNYFECKKITLTIKFHKIIYTLILDSKISIFIKLIITDLVLLFLSLKNFDKNFYSSFNFYP